MDKRYHQAQLSDDSNFIGDKGMTANSLPSISAGQTATTVAFIVFVGFLGLNGSFAQIGAPRTHGGIFPEVMSLFTLRSFGMFYLTPELAVVPHLWNKNLNAILLNFAAKSGGLLYFIANLVVGIPLIFVFRKLGTGAPI